MDPRTSSKVTAPDLLEAFHESAPRQAVTPDGQMVYLVLINGEEVMETSTSLMAELDVALALLQKWLQQGDGYAAFISIDTEPSELFKDAVLAISEKSE